MEIGSELGRKERPVRQKKQSERSETKPSAKPSAKPNARVKEAAPPDYIPVDKLIADAVEENEELTEQQKDFCIYFMRNRNATQAYLRAYGCTYATANTNGPALLVNTRVQEELRKLREIKNAALGDLCGEDLVELHMRIAFADITDFAEFRNRRAITMYRGRPVYITNPGNGEETMLTHYENEVRLNDSSEVDGTLIAEISEGRSGAKIKLRNQDASMKFLERYFDMNPNDRHKKEYDRHRLDLELLKIEVSQQAQINESDSPTSNFVEAMMAAADEVWEDYKSGRSEDDTLPNGK